MFILLTILPLFLYWNIYNFYIPRLLQNPPKSSQPLVEIPKAVENRPLHGGLDAFNKTYYHLPTDIGVVEELSMGDKSVKDAKALAEEVGNVMNEYRLKVRYEAYLWPYFANWWPVPFIS